MMTQSATCRALCSHARSPVHVNLLSIFLCKGFEQHAVLLHRASRTAPPSTGNSSTSTYLAATTSFCQSSCGLTATRNSGTNSQMRRRPSSGSMHVSTPPLQPKQIVKGFTNQRRPTFGCGLHRKADAEIAAAVIGPCETLARSRMLRPPAATLDKGLWYFATAQ